LLWHLDVAPQILSPVDFSDESRLALLAAAELARDSQASLRIIHVDERPLWIRKPYISSPGDVGVEAHRETAAKLAEWTELARQRGAENVTSSMLEGVPWERIVAVAREDLAVRWIVLGAHGRTGIQRVLLGSVAERVVRHAPCSVVIVRPPRSG
jgi:universal stress protein A